MESPGKHLKRERESRKLTVREVSASTRIKETILAAIEEDRYDLCPHPFYVKGFLTSYARHLGIDPASVLSEYHELLNPPAPSPEPVPAEEPKDTFLFLNPLQRRTAYRFLLVSVLLASLLTPLYFYYVFQSGSGPVPAVLNQQKPVTPSQGEENSPALAAANSMAAGVIPESQPETETVEVELKKENPPVLQQIRQLEMIGPKEVQAESFPKILEAHLGTGIELESGRPMVTGKGSEFRCENQRVYFFTRVMTAGEGKIFHVWQREGEEFHRIEMPVKPPSWSVYSYITLPPGRFGNWNVEARDGDKVLTRLNFKAH